MPGRIYQISISISSSTPMRSLTWVRTNSIRRSTSSLVVPGSGDDEIGVDVADFGPADFGAFESGLLDQVAARRPSGFLKMRPIFSSRDGCLVFHDPERLHAFGQFGAVFAFEGECARRMTRSSMLL